MTEYSIVTVVCSYRPAHDNPQEVDRFVVSDREPRGVLRDGARVVVDGERVEPRPEENTFRTYFRAAQETGHLPVAVIEMRCPAENCVITARVPDLGLRRALTRLAEHGIHTAELKDIERIVRATS